MTGILRPRSPQRKMNSVSASVDGNTARQRRSKRLEQVTKAVASPRRARVSSSSGQPPVLVRRGLQNMATPKAGSKAGSHAGSRSVRRRFDLTLNVPGAEVRLPSLPMIHVSWRVASGSLVLAMLFALYALLFSTTFQVKLLEVEGLQRLTIEDLNDAIGIIGLQAVNLDPQSIAQDLRAAYPEILDLKLSIGLPAAVKMQVVERQPIIAWVHRGEERWLDETGVLFPPRGEPAQPLLRVESDDLPLVVSPAQDIPDDSGELAVSALVEPEKLSPDLVKVVMSMRAYLPEGSTLVYSAERGFGWADPRGWQVYFGGKLQDVDQKLVVYQAIVNELTARGIQPALISVEYLHAPYYRMER